LPIDAGVRNVPLSFWALRNAGMNALLITNAFMLTKAAVVLQALRFDSGILHLKWFLQKRMLSTPLKLYEYAKTGNKISYNIVSFLGLRRLAYGSLEWKLFC